MLLFVSFKNVTYVFVYKTTLYRIYMISRHSYMYILNVCCFILDVFNLQSWLLDSHRFHFPGIFEPFWHKPGAKVTHAFNFSETSYSSHDVKNRMCCMRSHLLLIIIITKKIIFTIMFNISTLLVSMQRSVFFCKLKELINSLYYVCLIHVWWFYAVVINAKINLSI